MNNSNNTTKLILAAVFEAVEKKNSKRISAKNRSLGTSVFYDRFKAGFKSEIAIQATLSLVAENTAAWEAGMEAFTKASASIPEQVAEVQEQAAPSSEELEKQDAIENEGDDTASEIPVKIAGIEKALATITDDKELQAVGIEAYVEAIRQGQDEDEALSLALDAVTQDEEAWLKGQAAYYESSEQESEKIENDGEPKPQGRGIALAIIAALIVVIGMVIGLSLYHPTPKEIAVEKPAVDRSLVLQKAKDAMFKSEWKPGEFLLDDEVDPAKDKSTAGNGSFSKSGIKNAEEMVAFLGSGSDAANAVIGQFANENTGASKEEVLDPNNWVTVQSLKNFTYPANTLLRNGTVAAAGVRKGSIGDIFMLFVSPHDGVKTPVVAARGACINPQNEMPTPVTPQDIDIPSDTPKVYLQPKSTNPADYKYPPNKPVVPLVKVEPEKVAPKVEVKVESPSGIIDTPTNKPNSETGVTAPKAEVVEEAVRDAAPAPEKNVNPVNNGEVNTTDTGMPSGF